MTRKPKEPSGAELPFSEADGEGEQWLDGDDADPAKRADLMAEIER